MSSSARPADQSRFERPWLIAGGMAGAYALAHFLWFTNTPLGRVPVLDARETIALAETIFHHQLPAEPFYRAPGYALLLALLRTAGVSANALFTVALLLGVVFHAANAALAASIAGVWFGRAAGFAAGLLCALDPVFVHFAVQAGDATPALTCFLAGLYFVANATTHPKTPPRMTWALASVAWAFATALRPNYFAVWLLLPLLAVWQTRAIAATLAALVGTLVFVAVGLWQYDVCGKFGFLPAQGPYNLWAANAPGYHGRYYTQTLALPARLAAMNPARAESLLLYERATGARNATLDEANAYWHRRFVARVAHAPFDWLRQLARKGYALLNNWEQYNNETPAFHLQRSPWLRWNPIGWGVLLILGVPGAIAFARNPRAAWVATVIAAAVAGSALLFFVSARFRLPLAAMLAVVAGGGVAHLRALLADGRTRRVVLLGGTAAAAVAYSNFDDVADRSTYVQDHVLLARAAETIGDDRLASREATAALVFRPDHPDALRLVVTSYFNALLDDSRSVDDTGDATWLNASIRSLDLIRDDPELRAIAAVAVWRSGDHATAIREWQSEHTPSAAGALALTGEPHAIDNVAVPVNAAPPLLRLARDAILSHDAHAIAIGRRLFPTANR